jgi:phosphoribosylformylglycinamidine synthase I
LRPSRVFLPSRAVKIFCVYLEGNPKTLTAKNAKNFREVRKKTKLGHHQFLYCFERVRLKTGLRYRTFLKFGVIIFPGSNCDHDAYWTVEHVIKQPVTFLWHESHDLENCDAIIVPGGFAYGDYLRTGAIAKFSPVMESVRKFADGGGMVLGICNGFQILCESGLLPGALMRNAGLKYVCKPVHIRVENADTPYTNSSGKGDVLCIPIGHMEGNYFCDEATLAELRRDDRIVFRYCDESGQITAEANPNGSLDNIAGICSSVRNVLGMMPHPERASETALGCTDGVRIFESLVGAGVLVGK